MYIFRKSRNTDTKRVACTYRCLRISLHCYYNILTDCFAMRGYKSVVYEGTATINLQLFIRLKFTSSYQNALLRYHHLFFLAN